MKNITVELKTPIEAHGEPIKFLEIPLPLKYKHVKAMFRGSNQEEQVTALLVSVFKIPPSSVDELTVEDVAAIMGALGPFLEPFQQRVGTSLPS